MSYPLVSIVNSTPFNASGEVHYMSVFCKNDKYDVTTYTTWHAKHRGICLVTEISAVVNTPNGNIVASPYKSIGTSYSQFAIIQTGPSAFEVTRRVGAGEDMMPADYKEPAEEQK